MEKEYSTNSTVNCLTLTKIGYYANKTLRHFMRPNANDCSDWSTNFKTRIVAGLEMIIKKKIASINFIWNIYVMQKPSAAITTNKIVIKIINFVLQFLGHAPTVASSLVKFEFLLFKQEQL